ncbi:MAG: ComEC/Rec2 family competence protein, partial [bacterium]
FGGLAMRRRVPLHAGYETSPDAFGSIALLVAVALAGWLSAGLRGPDPERPLPDLAPGQAINVELIGIVDDTPVCVSNRFGKLQWSFPVAIERWRPTGGREQGWRASSGTIAARMPWMGDHASNTAYGDQRRWFGNLRAVPPRLANGGQTRLYLTIFPQHDEPLSTNAGCSLVAACLRVRAYAQYELSRGIEDFPETCAIIDSLLLGYRSVMPNNLYQEFARTGTLHIFAISGSHVVELAAVLVFALSALRLPRRIWVFSLGPALGLYVVMTGMQPSAVRAWVMATVFWIAPVARRRTDAYAATALSAIIILAVDPTDLANIGFVLSYVCVLGLVYLSPVFLAPMRGWAEPDPLLPPPAGGARASGQAVMRWLKLILATDLAAWLVSAPLTAWYFGLFSPIALIGNLIVVPLSGVIILNGCLSLLFGAILPPLAVVFNHANLALVTAMIQSTHWLESVPGGWRNVSPPPLWAMLCYYLLLLLTGAFFNRRKARRCDVADSI